MSIGIINLCVVFGGTYFSKQFLGTLTKCQIRWRITDGHLVINMLVVPVTDFFSHIFVYVSSEVTREVWAKAVLLPSNSSCLRMWLNFFSTGAAIVSLMSHHCYQGPGVGNFWLIAIDWNYLSWTRNWINSHRTKRHNVPSSDNCTMISLCFHFIKLTCSS